MRSLASLRLRLLAAGLVATLVALAVAGLVLVLLFQRQMERYASDQAEGYLRLVIAATSLDAEGRPQVLLAAPDPRFTEPYGGLYWQIDAATDQTPLIRSRSLWDHFLKLPNDRLVDGVTDHHKLPGPAGQSLLAVERPLILSGPDGPHRFRAVVAIDHASIDEARSDYTMDVIPALAVLGLALFGASALQVFFGLRPLKVLTEAVERVLRGDQRRLSADVPQEVAPLVLELNRLLDTRDRMIDRARGRAADLAHGLKTPLTALDGDVRRLAESGQTALAAEIGQLSGMMQTHVKRELARARIIGSADIRSIETLAPARAAVESIAATLARTPDGLRIAYEIDIDETFVVPMDRSDFDEVLGNLLENGARHGRSIVRVRAEDVAGRAVVSIEDDGEGVPEAEMERLTERGRTGAGRGDMTGGAAPMGRTGLGLAIVADIVEAYAGTLSFGRSDLGGLKVEFRLGRKQGR